MKLSLFLICFVRANLFQTYGADQDRTLGIPNESLRNVLSAREFVAWYNGLPGFEELNPDLSGRTLTLLGQGNVAVDVARIVLSGVDQLKKTDITEYALEALSRSNIRKVLLVGRRGPLQAAFTIKELREMIKLPHCATNWRPSDFHRMLHDLCVLDWVLILLNMFQTWKKACRTWLDPGNESPS